MTGTYFTHTSIVMLHANHVIFGFICLCFFFPPFFSTNWDQCQGFYECFHCVHFLTFSRLQFTFFSCYFNPLQTLNFYRSASLFLVYVRSFGCFYFTVILSCSFFFMIIAITQFSAVRWFCYDFIYSQLKYLCDALFCVVFVVLRIYAFGWDDRYAFHIYTLSYCKTNGFLLLRCRATQILQLYVYTSTFSKVI